MERAVLHTGILASVYGEQRRTDDNFWCVIMNITTCHLCHMLTDCQDIGAAWKMLENAEKGFEEWLLSEMQR